MKKYRWVLLGATLLILCCSLSMCASALLPNPQAEPAAWTAMSEVMASNRLFGFLAFLTFGNCGGVTTPLLLIGPLLAWILWRGRKVE